MRAAAPETPALYPPFTALRRTGFLRAIAAVVAVCVLIAGCERNRPSTDTTRRISVQDDAGRSVTLPRAAARIVSLLPTVTDLVIALGHAERLIARTDYDADPRIAHLPSIGGGLTPSIEWLAAQQPDLVVSWPDNASRSLVSKIESVGVPVYAARTETIADALRTIHNMGVLLNAASAADSLAHSITSELDSVRGAVSGLKRARVAYVLAVQPLTIAGPATFIDELIQIAGGENVFADVRQPFPEVNLEELVRRDPDVIVLARESTSDAEDLLRKLPGWRELRAVQRGHVHRVSPDYFNRSGPLMPRAARELAQFFDAAR
jgi:iron complex transport system substrate-binding protein